MDELRTKAKHLTQEEQYGLRKSIIRLLKKGHKPVEVAALLDISRSHVYATKKTYDEKGVEGIKAGKRGRRNGAKRIMTPEQEKEIRGSIIEHNPEQMSLPGCMWTRENIRDLIKRKYGITLPLSTMGYYLARWGFSVQRPIKRAYKQDERKTTEWVEREFPGIRERARKEHAEIFFGDETGIQSTANYARGYAPIGQTPIVRVEAAKIKINMLSAVSNRGKLRFMLYKDMMNSDKLIDFMRRLVRDTPKKVFLVLDNLRVHHSKRVIAWLNERQNEIELFYLPPYAPEYNPGEFLNSDLKRGVGSRAMPRTLKELEHNVRSHMKAVQLRPGKIRSFFLTPTMIYAT
jgi:transposase